MTFVIRGIVVYVISAFMTYEGIRAVISMFFGFLELATMVLVVVTFMPICLGEGRRGASGTVVVQVVGVEVFGVDVRGDDLVDDSGGGGVVVID